MKGNNGTGNVSNRDYWETLKWLFDLLSPQYFLDIDCCATKTKLGKRLYLEQS